MAQNQQQKRKGVRREQRRELNVQGCLVQRIGDLLGLPLEGMLGGLGQSEGCGEGKKRRVEW